MQYSIFALAAIAGLATAQVAGVPQCANSCVNSLLPKNCGADFVCICTSPGFIDNISCCVSTACDLAGQTQALQYAQQICSGANVVLPSAAGCTANSTSATAFASSASATGSVSSSISSALSSISSSASSASHSASSAASSAASSSSRAATSAAASTSSAFGNKLAAQGMGVGAAFMGLAAFL